MEPIRKYVSPQLLWMALAAVFLLLTVSAQPVLADSNSCINCHSDQERLKGYTQSWSKVYVDEEKFSQEAHGGLECTICHSGDITKDTPEEACVGIAYKDPAAPDTLPQTCGSCHPDITKRHLDSIHATLNGIRTSLHDFEGEAEGEKRFQESCNKCHATCSNCHMEQPGAHGLLQPRAESHAFAPESATDVCVACHDGTGMSYLGNLHMEGAVPSSMAVAGIDCMTCHVEEDVHGTGLRTTFLSETPKPECQTCHSDPTYLVDVASGMRVAPQYDFGSGPHTDHDSTVSCVACHTQWYESCWNCHNGREERKTTRVYLAINPLTGLVHTAVHSPATSPDWGSISPEIGGGWAIKSRHSWGESQTCETCHTEADIYISGTDRDAPFLGVWGESRSNAYYVDEDKVQDILIDLDALAGSVHRDITCLNCHATVDDATCFGCHTESERSGTTILPDYTNWSRTDYMTARDGLREAKQLLVQVEAAGLRKQGWSVRWTELKQNFLQVSNGFHAKPGEAQLAVVDIGSQIGELNRELTVALAQAEARKNWLNAGIPFGIGLIGAIGIGVVFVKPAKKNNKERLACEKI